MTGENAASIEYARAADAKRKVQKKENRIFDIKPESKMTFQELTDWYLGLEKVKALASYPSLNVYLKKFNSEFGKVIIDQIKPADLENLQAQRKAEGLAEATADHEIGHARGMIIKAFDNDLVSGDTLKAFKKVKKLLKRNSNARKKIITLKQFNDLMDNLPQHVRAILATAFWTGMRRGEILSLTWTKVDMKNKVIHLDAHDTKDREARTIPIFEELYQILKELPQGLHDDHVFLNEGRPVTGEGIRGPLMTACKGQGLFMGGNHTMGSHSMISAIPLTPI